MTMDILSLMIWSGYSVVLTAILVLSILSSTWIIYSYRRSGEINTDEFKALYGTLTEGVNTKTRVGSFWKILILIRWTLTMLSLVFLRESIGLQIISLLINSVFF